MLDGWCVNTYRMTCTPCMLTRKSFVYISMLECLWCHSGFCIRSVTKEYTITNLCFRFKQLYACGRRAMGSVRYWSKPNYSIELRVPLLVDETEDAIGKQLCAETDHYSGRQMALANSCANDIDLPALSTRSKSICACADSRPHLAVSCCNCTSSPATDADSKASWRCCRCNH